MARMTLELLLEAITGMIKKTDIKTNTVVKPDSGKR